MTQIIPDTNDKEVALVAAALHIVERSRIHYSASPSNKDEAEKRVDDYLALYEKAIASIRLASRKGVKIGS